MHGIDALSQSRGRRRLRPATGALLLAAMAAVAVTASSAGATGTLDQSVPIGTPANGYWDVAANEIVSQTFTAGSTGNMDQVDLPLESYDGTLTPADVTLSVRAMDGADQFSGTLLGSTTFSDSAITNTYDNPSWVSIPLSAAIPVVAGTQYSLVVTTTDANFGEILWLMNDEFTSNYAGGQSSVIFFGGLYTEGGDMAFKTYVSPSITPIDVTVSGSQSYGSSSPSFNTNQSLPNGISLSGTVSCTSVSGTPDVAIGPSLGATSYTLDPATCSGLSLTGTGNSNYSINYLGGAFTVSQASTSVAYTGATFAVIGNSLGLSAQLASSASSCKSGQTITYSLDRSPVTGAAGTYQLGSNATDSSGNTATLKEPTTGWQDGTYALTASFAGTTDCASSSDTEFATLASPSDAASGGGWYSANGRNNFGFTVHLVPKTTSTYTGQIQFQQNGKWRLKGTLSNYGKTGSTGKASGTGDLFWMDSSGAWMLAKSGINYTATFTATTKTSPGSFGISISGYTPVSPQPATLPSAVPTALKGGQINIS